MKNKLPENKSDEVNEWMLKLKHPLKAEIEAVRKIVMDANSAIAEHIKWAAPSFFCTAGLDKTGMATFNHRQPKYVHLVFHNGIILNDQSGLLQGDYKDRRMAYFYSMEDIESKKKELVRAVNTWVEIISNS
ncbi:DUF1801 domain-containing protein [Paradesertivirga mongoliensis]|uniref:DUF1801 domain-containing protein n=1 Tax=Paradesertivirga mongoliensis TaxID=2100740 RepID=A0ABW4ZNT7_9SPHI|nr:DUF1801 domain-containing protein [Pedobacter mongoliensis]